MTPEERAQWDVDPDLWPATPPLHVFRELMAEDHNLWWRAGSGHGLNAYEAAIEELEKPVTDLTDADGTRWVYDQAADTYQPISPDGDASVPMPAIVFASVYPELYGMFFVLRGAAAQAAVDEAIASAELDEPGQGGAHTGKTHEAPDTLLGKLAADMLKLVDDLADEEVRAIVMLHKGTDGMTALGGYEHDEDGNTGAMADLFLYLQSIAEANGRTLEFIGIPDHPPTS